MIRCVRLLAAVVAVAVLSSVAACGSSTAPAPEPPGTIHVLAGSELKDMQPVLDDMYKATGINLRLDFTGTLDGAEAIVNGSTNGASMAWFSSTRYLTLLPGSQSKMVASQKIMLSPVVIGVKHSVAQRFGWIGNASVTWKDIAAQAKNGNFRFGMTNPAASNSGFSALVGVASAFAGTGDALQVKDINAAELTDLFDGQAVTAGSSGFLADSYVANQSRLDGLINYESVLLSLNAGGKLKEPIDLIYPKDGIITADYPMVLLDRSKQAAYDKVAAYLRTPSVQLKILHTTRRRPAAGGGALDSRFPAQILLELPFPANLDVVNTLLTDYLDKFSRPSHTIYILDLSGSMDGDRLNGLKQALTNLTGADTSVAGKFTRFRNREKVTMIPFSDAVHEVKDFTVDTSAGSTSLSDIKSYVESLQAGGGTAIYSAVDQAYQVADAALTQDPTYLTSIVLLTDGENNEGISLDQLLSNGRNRSDPARAVKTFPILFGEGNPGDLTRLATATGGQVFDSRSTSLSQIFKEIRGYQ